MKILRRLWYMAQLLKRGGGVRGVKQMTRDAPKQLALMRSLCADPRVPAKAKAILVGAGVFAVSPLNIPNFIPIIGLIDDIGIAMLAHGYFMKNIPADILAEHRAKVGLD
jgi:uncharacterized membrane protein YkvA (DUF1232 family)